MATGNCSTVAVWPATSRANLQNLPIEEFQRIVLNVRIVQIDLPKAGDLVIHAGLAKKAEGAVVPNLVVEGQLRSG